MLVKVEFPIPISGNRNFTYGKELTQKLYELESFPELDEMFSQHIGRTVKVLRLYRNLIRRAQEDDIGDDGYRFRDDEECVTFAVREAASFDDFVTIVAHEAAHGVLHFHWDEETDGFRKFNLGKDDEEAFCWKVSRLVCAKIGYAYNEQLATLLFNFHIATQHRDATAVEAAHAALPERHRFL